MHTPLKTIQLITRRHLNLDCISVAPINEAPHASVYTVTTDNNSQYIVRCIYNTELQTTESQVSCMQFVRGATSIPVPRVLGFSSDNREVGVEYIIMEKIPGENLLNTWEQLSFDDQKEIVRQLGGFARELRSLRSTLIGGLQGANLAISLPTFCAGPATLARPRRFGNLMDVGGPFGSVKEYFVTMLQAEISVLEVNANDLKPNLELLPGLKTLIQMVSAGEGSYDFSQVPIVMSHNDLEDRNILVQGSIITGVVDWEFSGFYPPWCDEVKSFSFFDDIEELSDIFLQQVGEDDSSFEQSDQVNQTGLLVYELISILSDCHVSISSEKYIDRTRLKASDILNTLGCQ